MVVVAIEQMPSLPSIQFRMKMLSEICHKLKQQSYVHLANRHWWFWSIGIITLKTYVFSTLSTNEVPEVIWTSLGFFILLFLLLLNVCKPKNSKHNNIFFKIFNEHLIYYFNYVLTAVVNHWLHLLPYSTGLRFLFGSR